MVSYLAYLDFTNLPVRKSYTVNERADLFRHSFIRNWNCLPAGLAGAAAGLVPCLIGMLYAVTPKIKSNANVLSYMYVNLMTF